MVLRLVRLDVSVELRTVSRSVNLWEESDQQPTTDEEQERGGEGIYTRGPEAGISMLTVVSRGWQDRGLT